MASSVSANADAQIFQLALNSPDVIQNSSREELPTDERERIKQTVVKAIELCDKFRKEEGTALESKNQIKRWNHQVCLLEVEKKARSGKSGKK